ncbi:hypothetical protein ACIP9G_02795 [Lysinibacillus sp. NPDC093197]|uniref:hypothetical protein n=1 Tax=Lysinibacillus sp. NPDC093197 TaxID=3364132 RepID=UPI00380CC0B5
MVKINLFTAFILFVLFICSKLFMEKFQNDALVTVKDLDNAAGAMVAMVVIGGLVGMLLIGCSILLPLIIPLFSNFKNNLKSLIGIVICNLGISYFLLLNFTLQLALCYFLPTLVGHIFRCISDGRKNVPKSKLGKKTRFGSFYGSILVRGDEF